MLIPTSDKINQTTVIEKTLIVLLIFLFICFTFLFSITFTLVGSLLASAAVIAMISLITELGVVQPLENLRKELRKCSYLSEEQNKSARLLIRRDLELSRANEKLQEIDKVKSSFISVVAHQLRTPLSGIKWTLNMVLSGDLGPLSAEQKDFLQKSYISNDRMIALVNDMLGADRLQSGKLRFDMKPAKVTEFMDSVLFELREAAVKKEITIEKRGINADLPYVMIDLEKVRGVFQNLLENAIKYTMKQGKVVIEAQVEGTEVHVSIRDSGIGIPPDEQSKIFKRFFRARNAVRTETEGSGLGLFIAEGIILRHGGRIWFESEEGKGTTFHFTLPSAKSTASLQQKI